MEVPSTCPQVSLMLTQMNLGLSPSTVRREAMGPESPKRFLHLVSVPELTLLACLTARDNKVVQVQVYCR